jgi:hypothetical protein
MSVQVVVVPEIVRHGAGNESTSVPVVVVLSVTDPPDLAIHVPDTCNEPVTGADVHPTPSDVRSAWPLTFKHPAALQVPTKLPPQGTTFEGVPEQVTAIPLLEPLEETPELAPDDPVPPELLELLVDPESDPLGGVSAENDPQATHTTMNVAGTSRARVFLSGCFIGELLKGRRLAGAVGLCTSIRHQTVAWTWNQNGGISLSDSCREESDATRRRGVPNLAVDLRDAVATSAASEYPASAQISSRHPTRIAALLVAEWAGIRTDDWLSGHDMPRTWRDLGGHMKVRQLEDDARLTMRLSQIAYAFIVPVAPVDIGFNHPSDSATTTSRDARQLDLIFPACRGTVRRGEPTSKRRYVRAARPRDRVLSRPG